VKSTQLKTTVIYSALGLGTATGFDNDNYLGWGTNEEMVLQVFREIPSKSMYSKVQREYFNLYGKSLNADLEQELSSEEYNELIRILNAKN